MLWQLERRRHSHPTKTNSFVFGQLIFDELMPGKNKIPAHLPYFTPVGYYTFVGRILGKIHYASIVRSSEDAIVVPGHPPDYPTDIHTIYPIKGMDAVWYAEGSVVEVVGAYKIGDDAFILLENEGKHEVFKASAPLWERVDVGALRSPEREILI